jgi:hypothetical protein
VYASFTPDRDTYVTRFATDAAARSAGSMFVRSSTPMITPGASSGFGGWLGPEFFVDPQPTTTMANNNARAMPAQGRLHHCRFIVCAIRSLCALAGSVLG